MKIFGIAGWSGSGKTTLILRLLPALARRRVRVATLKHTHHDPLLADPESSALIAAGATQALVASPRRFALMQVEDGAALAALAARFGDVDLLLVEGFKFADHDKLEVWDPVSGRSPLALNQPSVVAVAADMDREFNGLPRFRRDDADGIADFIVSRIGC